MSEESTDKVKEHLAEEWETSEAQQDPVELWKAIKLTHTAYSTGNPFTDKQQLRQAYSDMKMHAGETLLNLKLRFTTALRAMEAVGINIPSDEDQASDYIAKLDSRWASLKTQLANDFLRGVSSQPKTLMDAYLLAASWKVVLTTPSGQTSTVFATTLKTHVDTKGKNNKTQDQGGKKNTDQEKKAPKGGCHLCGGPHFVKVCPEKRAFRKANQEQPNDPTPNTERTPQAEAPSGSTTRTHLTYNADGSVSFTTMCFSTSDNDQKAWLKERILFDPAAQSSSFCNSDFVSNIRKRNNPINNGGQIEGSAVCTEEATFMNEITVDFREKFTTNILGGSAMRRSGYYWDYDPMENVFRLFIGDKEIIFTNENDLYVYDPRQDYEIAHVNATMITKAQERKAEEAQELMKRLGYPSPQRMIAAIREGALTNSGVSPEDIRRSDLIFGRPYPYLAGKAVWRDPMLPPTVKAELLPESTLEGHTDIMFLCNKKVIALVTVFKPIDLVLTRCGT